ncbi:subtilisin-like protease SBT3.3 [Capsicum annuum]
MMEVNGLNQTMVDKLYKLSPLDDIGHGTHVAYTAAGSYVNNVKYYGLNMGTVHGGAPLARLAIYKAVGLNKGVEDIKFIASGLKGKVLMLFFKSNIDASRSLKDLKGTGVLACICATLPVVQIDETPIPFLTVDFEQGNQIFDYFQQCISNNQDPIIKYGQAEILEGKETYIKVPQFSSRGPNSFAPEILKLLVLIYLQHILLLGGDNGFKLLSGTSMEAPHITGIVALLKVAHPDWSSAAIKSALMTTAWNEDTYATEIYTEGTGGKLADPFDIGSGICNPNGAVDPGLIYDMDTNDYSIMFADWDTVMMKFTMQLRIIPTRKNLLLQEELRVSKKYILGWI